MEKELKISRINIFEYFGCNGDLKSALSDYYVKNNNCVILSAADHSGKQAGLLIYEEKTVIEILYFKANDRFCKKEILDYLILSSDKSIRYRTAGSEDDEKAALDCGFRYESTLNIYRSIDKNHPNASVFLEKCSKLYLSSIKRNCKTKSFEELNEDELNQIKYDPDNEFVPEFDSAKFLDNNFSDLSKRISTAVIKNNKVAAYSLLHCIGNNKCIFEILCVAKSHRKSFVIVPAVMRSLNEMLKEGLTYVTFAVYQRNTEMIRILENNMREVIESVTVQHNLIYRKEGKRMNFTNEQLTKAKTAKSAEELIALAKAEGIALTEEEAAKYFAELNKEGELSDDELGNVSGGGCGEEEPVIEQQVIDPPPPPSKYHPGDNVWDIMECMWGTIVDANWDAYYGEWVYTIELRRSPVSSVETINELEKDISSSPS